MRLLRSFVLAFWRALLARLWLCVDGAVCGVWPLLPVWCASWLLYYIYCIFVFVRPLSLRRLFCLIFRCLFPYPNLPLFNAVVCKETLSPLRGRISDNMAGGALRACAFCLCGTQHHTTPHGTQGLLRRELSHIPLSSIYIASLDQTSKTANYFSCPFFDKADGPASHHQKYRFFIAYCHLSLKV